MKNCIKCGAALKDEAMFCDECGTKQINEIVEQSNLSINNENERSEGTTFNEIVNETNEIVNNKTKSKQKTALIISIIAITIVLLVVILNANKKPNDMTQEVYDIGVELLEDVDLCLDKKMSIDRLLTKINSAYHNIYECRQSDSYPDSRDTSGDFSLEMLCFKMIPDKLRTDQAEIELYQIEEFREELKEELSD